MKPKSVLKLLHGIILRDFRTILESKICCFCSVQLTCIDTSGFVTHYYYYRRTPLIHVFIENQIL